MLYGEQVAIGLEDRGGKSGSIGADQVPKTMVRKREAGLSIQSHVLKCCRHTHSRL